MNAKIAHLQIIQTVISRMASNSFLLKGWSVVLVAALFALAAPKQNVNFVCLAYFPAILFWGLDGFFLMQERRYRDLYDDVRKLQGSDEDVDFSMDAKQYMGQAGRRWFGATFSWTLIPFHGVLIVAIAIVMLLNACG